MKVDMTKDLSYYLNLPYTITLQKDDEGCFVARIAELPGCLADGESEAIAIENLRSMQALWIEDALDSKHEIPEPDDEAELPSGKWLQRVPRRLHRGLVDLARRENISLNQLVTSMLSEALTVRWCANAFEAILASKQSKAFSGSGWMIDCQWWGRDVVAHQAPGNWSTFPLPHGDVMEILSRAMTVKQTQKFSYDPGNAPFGDEHAEERPKQLARK
jgi:predicted RNase H-like HicB family nuclease